MTGNFRALLGNTGALFVIQLANYVLPFLLIPYLTRVLGVEGYGVVAFGLSMVQVAYVITDYGFSLSATYSIAKAKGDSLEVRKIFTAVMLCKAGLLFPVAGLFLAFVFFQEKYVEYKEFFYLLLLPVIGQAFQPIWFFQGVERMLFITLYTVVSRILYLLLTVLLVTSQADLYLVAVTNGVSTIVAAAIGIAAVLKLGYWPSWCGWAYVTRTFKESTEFFWSRAAVATYTAGGAFFLGLFSSPGQVAYYSAAEQLYRGAQSLFSPVSQALYPYMAKHQDLPLFFKLLKLSLFICAAGLVVGVFLGQWATVTIFGTDFSPAYPVLLVFMITFCVTTPSTLLGYPFLGALGDTKTANMSVIYAGGLQAIMLLIAYVADFISALNIALAVLVVELFVLLNRSSAAVRVYHGIR